MLCVVRYRSLRRADHPSRGVLPTVVCLAECDREAKTMKRPRSTRGCCAMEKNTYCLVKATNYKFPHQENFSNVLLLSASWKQIIILFGCSQMQLIYSLCVRYHISRPYKSRGKIALYHYQDQHQPQ